MGTAGRRHAQRHGARRPGDPGGRLDHGLAEGLRPTEKRAAARCTVDLRRSWGEPRRSAALLFAFGAPRWQPCLRDLASEQAVFRARSTPEIVRIVVPLG